MTPRLAWGDSLPSTRVHGKSAIERLMDRTAESVDGCWVWMGRTNADGYGSIRIDKDRPSWSVHRVSYEYFVGPIPDGLVLDHLCRNRRCVNPAHLEPVTHAENLRRGLHANRDKTECKHGHPFDHANTHILANGSRVCRACNRESQRRCKQRKEANQ